MVEKAIFNHLSTYSGTSAIVGTRVYPDLLPQNATLPAITYELFSTERPKSFDGFWGKAAATYRFNCMDENPTTASNLRNQLVKAMDVMRGTYASCVVSGVNFVGEWDDWQPDTRRARKIADFQIWYVES